LEKEKSPLLKLKLLKWPTRPLIIIMAGCHGEEIAPVLALFKYYQEIYNQALKSKINLIIYPLVNPWGFARKKRLNRKGLNCNKNWVHKTKSKVAVEIKAIKNDLKKVKPKIFITLHEDKSADKFYLYYYGQAKYKNLILKIGTKFFNLLNGKNSDKYFIKNGNISNVHDTSAEYYMSHKKSIAFSCCTETPSKQLMRLRLKCNKEIIINIIKLAA